ncbi:helix-turn-helix domain-containing protein [Roseivirga sp. BDSF3-8]|uniref:helix-turn-helix domain-containing protein n=1 Tax=Roseivirga sp. BDSF3-8 TaxID=3241598 RepID=UPI0035322FD3
MDNETIESFYKSQKFELTNDLGNFYVSTIGNLSRCSIEPIPFSRRNFYKVSILKGTYRVHFADKTYEVENQALLFANPSIPYNWVPLEGSHTAIYCVFTPEFFHHFGDITAYAAFRAEGQHVIELDDKQFHEMEGVFLKMLKEFSTDYEHKFDLLRNLVFEVLHFASKTVSTSQKATLNSSASRRITEAFLALLESQFPIETTEQKLLLTTPSDYANALSLHVNYLNRTLKKTMGASTSALIQERIVREAKVLLKHSTLSVSEIAFLLGFREITHFSNFFKKMEGLNPTEYRKG